VLFVTWSGEINEGASWLICPDELLSMSKRNGRPQPKRYGPVSRPTLDDFDKPSVIWGNA